MKAIMCLKVKNGIVVTIPGLDGNVKITRSEENIPLTLDPAGLALIYKAYRIPIPEEMFDYILENRIVGIYEVNANQHLQTPSAIFEISRDSLIEGIAVYRHEKNRRQISSEPAISANGRGA